VRDFPGVHPQVEGESVVSEAPDPEWHEYYCYDCKQLRLNLKGAKAEACGNCGSSNIQADQVGSQYLSDLRQRLASRGADLPSHPGKSSRQ
jgi:hypothetical protein